MSALREERASTGGSESTKPEPPRGYTSRRRPVVLVYAEEFQRITDAIAAERRIKGWSRAKKEALIEGDWARVQVLAKRSGALRSSDQPPSS